MRLPLWGPPCQRWWACWRAGPPSRTCSPTWAPKAPPPPPPSTDRGGSGSVRVRPTACQRKDPTRTPLTPLKMGELQKLQTSLSPESRRWRSSETSYLQERNPRFRFPMYFFPVREGDRVETLLVRGCRWGSSDDEDDSPTTTSSTRGYLCGIDPAATAQLTW